MELKALVNNAITMLRENEKSTKEMRTSMATTMANQEFQIKQLKDQVAELKKLHVEKDKMDQTSFAEIKQCVTEVSDNIPQNLKEESHKQKEERVQKLLEVKKPEDCEKPNYDQMVNEIIWKCNQEDVIIKDDLPNEVIRKLVVAPDIMVRFEAGQIVVAKKIDDPAEGFDAEAARKEFEEKKTLANKIKYDALLEKQMAYVKAKVKEQIEAYKKNPYNYEKILLSEPAEVVSGNPQEMVVSEAVKNNPMYAEFNDGYSCVGYHFMFLDGVIGFLKKQGMVMEIVPKDNSECKFIQISYDGWWFYTSDKSVRIEQSGELFENCCCFYYIKGAAEIRLHVVTPEEKNIINRYGG